MHSIVAAANSIETTLSGDDVRATLRSVRSACSNLEEFSKQLQSGSGHLIQSAERMCRELATLSCDIRKLLSSGAPLPLELETFLRCIGSAASSVRNFFDFLEENPNALLVGKPKGE
jgi:hypothetical protein